MDPPIEYESIRASTHTFSLYNALDITSDDYIKEEIKQQAP